MDTIQALKTRRSIRVFRGGTIPREVLEDIVDCGRLAPTAINIQPWEFVVITEPERLKQVAEATDHGRFIARAAACVVVVCKAVKYYLEDGSAATENILLAAHARGLAACWVAGDKKWYAEQMLELLGIPKGYKLVSLIPIGHGGEEPAPRKRPLSEVLHWENFQTFS